MVDGYADGYVDVDGGYDRRSKSTHTQRKLDITLCVIARDVNLCFVHFSFAHSCLLLPTPAFSCPLIPFRAMLVPCSDLLV